MMVINIQGGLGNQMFQYAFGRSVGLARGEDVRFDVSLCRDQDEYAYSLGVFGLNILLATGRERHELRHRGEPVFKYDPSVYTDAPNLFWNGYWQTEKYFNVPILRDEFHFRMTLSQKAVELQERIEKGPSAFIHVRGGDYLVEPHKSFHGLQTLDYYNAAMARIKQESPNTNFFVFSDNKEWCRQNFSEHTLVDGTTKFEDMWLMTFCQHAVICNSSFSWWGAWLGDEQKDRIVIAPRKWFQSTSMCQDDIVPDRWFRL